MLTYGSRLPSTVKNITVFEDFNETYLDAFKQDHGPNKWLSPDPVRRTNPRLGHAFAVRSLCLESLSVAFMIDAAHFLACCHRDWVWIRLKSLTLTSRYLSEDNATRTNKILGYAGRVAVSMPELEDMTLWNAGRGHACKFTWCRRDASISWRASWRLPLVRGVVNEWREVAGIYTDKQLTVHREVLTDDIPSHAYAIARLGLNHVVDATSLLQMLRENSGV